MLMVGLITEWLMISNILQTKEEAELAVQIIKSELEKSQSCRDYHKQAFVLNQWPFTLRDFQSTKMTTVRAKLSLFWNLAKYRNIPVENIF